MHTVRPLAPHCLCCCPSHRLLLLLLHLLLQPRRVAAMSVAKRVSEEMGVELGQEVREGHTRGGRGLEASLGVVV